MSNLKQKQAIYESAGEFIGSVLFSYGIVSSSTTTTPDIYTALSLFGSIMMVCQICSGHFNMAVTTGNYYYKRFFYIKTAQHLTTCLPLCIIISRLFHRRIFILPHYRYYYIPYLWWHKRWQYFESHFRRSSCNLFICFIDPLYSGQR